MFKKGLVSYKRDLDEDEEYASSAPQEESLPISAQEKDVKATIKPGSSSEEPIRNETEEESRPQATAISSTVIAASDSTSVLETPSNSTTNVKKRRKTDYSQWTTVPRPASVHNPDVERFIAWAQSGKSINSNLRNSKEFHNPGILTELVKMCGVKERGTNIPPEKRGLSFAPSDYHDALIAAQEAQLMARLSQQQPGKRTHIDFVKRPNPNSYQGAPDAKRFKR